MTKDLENTIAELGPEYRSVVDRLLSMSSAPVANHQSRTINHQPRIPTPFLLVASLLLVLGFAIWSFTSMSLRSSLVPRASSSASAPRVYTVAYAADEFALQTIIESQRNDGSWSNDYLTMQNAAALRQANDSASRIAYKRAVRYLRTKGLGPLSDAEFRRRSVRAFPAG